MSLNATNFVVQGPIRSADLKQFVDLFTGVMTDQPVTFKNAMVLGGNQGSSTPPLKLYGAIGQTSNLIELYPDTTSSNASFGFAALGQFAWGPGGAAANDTFLSRIALQNGHVSDTAGVLIDPYLEVNGNVSADGYMFNNQAVLSGPTANPFLLQVNQDLYVQRFLGVGTINSPGNFFHVTGTFNSTTGNGILLTTNHTGVTSNTYGLNFVPGFTVAADMTSQEIFGAVGGPTVTSPTTFTVASVGSLRLYGPGKSGNVVITKAVGLKVDPITTGTTSNVGVEIDAPIGGDNNWSLIASGRCALSALNSIGAARIESTAYFANGEGLEMVYNPGGSPAGGGFQTYNRTASAWRSISMSGSVILLMPQGGQGYAAYVSIAGNGAAPNSPSAQLAFAQAVGNKICIYDVGGGGYYGIGINNNELIFTAPNGAGWNFRRDNYVGPILASISNTGAITGASLTSNAHVAVGGGSMLIYSNTAGARADLVNFGGNGDVTQANGSYLAFRRNYDNLIMQTFWGDGRVSIQGGFTAFNVGYSGYALAAPNIANANGMVLAQSHPTYSSLDFKANVRAIDDPISLVLDDALHGVSYERKDDATPDIGFVADYWLDVVPQIVTTGENGKAMSMDYARVGAITFEALKSYIIRTDARLEALERKLAA